MTTWKGTRLVKAADYNIRWYQIDEINIIASDGDMRRAAVDLWVDMVREIIASRAEDETLYVLFDFTGDKQGTTPYSILTGGHFLGL